MRPRGSAPRRTPECEAVEDDGLAHDVLGPHGARECAAADDVVGAQPPVRAVLRDVEARDLGAQHLGRKRVEVGVNLEKRLAVPERVPDTHGRLSGHRSVRPENLAFWSEALW